MPALTPQFLMDLESRMRIATEESYAALSANTWWQRVARVRPSTGRRELLTWLLSTAMIKPLDDGSMRFEDMVMVQTEYENGFAGAGLRLRRSQLEDTDGGGVDLAAQWSRDIGDYMAYWPQKQISNFLMKGHLTAANGGFNSYDGTTASPIAFFSGTHPVDPSGSGVSTTFANLFTAGNGPGAVPIDVSVTADVALGNLSKIFGYLGGIKMPNGEDPRRLKPAAIICGPTLFPRVVQLTNAKFIAQAASSGGGSGDVDALIQSLGYSQPILAEELAGFESDTTYFVLAEQTGNSQIGPVIYSDREAFKITYYTGQGGGTGVDAVLDRANELEWHCRGRNAVASGHPYLLFKCKAA